MATGSPSFHPIKTLSLRLFGGRGGVYFLEARFLPYVLPFFLGMALALASAVFVIRGNWLFLIPLVVAVPIAILFLRYPFVAVLLWLLVFPFFFQQTVPGSRYMYDLLHRAMIPAAFGIAILVELLKKDKKNSIRIGAGEWGILLFLILSTINILLLDTDQVSGFIRFYDRLFVPFCIYGLVRLTAPSIEDMKRIAWIAPVVVATQSFIGLLAWFAPGMLPHMWLNRFGQRTVGTFGSPGMFSLALIFSCLFLIQYAIQSRSKLVRIICFSLVGMALFAIFFSFSRGSWLGALLVFLGIFYLYPRMMFRISVVFAVSITLVTLTLFRPYLTFAYERLTTQSTADGRILGDYATLHVIGINPLFGVGFGNQDLYDEQFRQRVLDLAVNQSHTSHNTYLLMVAEMGIVGLIFYMIPLAWWFLASRKVLKKMPKEGYQGRSMLIMLWLFFLAFFAIANFTDLFQSGLFATGLWWMALGLIATLTSPYLAPDAIDKRAAPRLNVSRIERGRVQDEPLKLYQERTMESADQGLKQEIAVETRPQQTEYIFIVGVSRSGTSLMRQILNQSDSIAISRENHFLGHLIGSEGMRQKFLQFGDLSEDENVRKLVDFIYSGGLEKISRLRGMSSYWRWVMRRVKKEDFLQAMLASDRSEKGIFIALMRLFADHRGKLIMGEKTPSHIRYVPTLLKWFPNAKVIHMLRDPRGVFVSELRRRYLESDSVPYKQLKKVYPMFKSFILLQTTVTWLESVRLSHRYQKLFPDNYYLMKFEDLVSEPEANIQSICRFLGVDFQEEMLDQSVVSSGFRMGQAGFDANAANRWKKGIDPWSNAWFSLIFRRYLKEYRYSE